MTCDQSRTLMQRFNTISRGERAGLFVHLRGCYACYKDMERLNEAEGPATAEEDAEINRVLAEDYQDPEFVESLYERGCQ